MGQEELKSSSPVLGERFLGEKAAAGEATFSAAGAVHKTGFLLLFTVVAACLSWTHASAFAPYLMPLILVGMVLGLIICFVPAAAPGLAPFYAILEGLFLGTVSAYYELAYQGVVFQAAALKL